MTEEKSVKEVYHYVTTFVFGMIVAFLIMQQIEREESLETAALMNHVIKLDFRIKLVETKLNVIAPRLQIHYNGYESKPDLEPTGDIDDMGSTDDVPKKRR